MPNGITAPISEGKDITAAEFILRCAKQFGGLSHMREDSLDAPIVPRETSTKRYDENIARVQKELDYYNSISIDTVEELVEESYKDEVALYNKRVAEKTELRARYQALIDKVIAWEIPSEEHTKLKEFALNQLVESIDWDCKVYEEPKKMSAQEWLDTHIESRQRNLNFWKKQREDDIKSVEGANKWAADLVNSLWEFHAKSLEEGE